MPLSSASTMKHSYDQTDLHLGEILNCEPRTRQQFIDVKHGSTVVLHKVKHSAVGLIQTIASKKLFSRVLKRI